jgi:hypothetical protein
MKKFFLIAGIVCSLATLALLILFINGLVRGFQHSENPILIAILLLGPSLLISGFATWACWTYYADQPGKKEELPVKDRKTAPNFWSDLAGKDQKKKADPPDKGTDSLPHK